jgi:hypothetical protein
LDAVGANNDIGFSGAAVGKCQARHVRVLVEADAAMAGANGGRRQRIRQYPQKIGAVHAVEAVPAA